MARKWEIPIFQPFGVYTPNGWSNGKNRAHYPFQSFNGLFFYTEFLEFQSFSLLVVGCNLSKLHLARHSTDNRGKSVILDNFQVNCSKQLLSYLWRGEIRHSRIWGVFNTYYACVGRKLPTRLCVRLQVLRRDNSNYSVFRIFST